MFRVNAVSFLVAILFVLVGLTFGWVSAARADEPGDFADCKAKVLNNGRPGETVRVCTVKSPTQRVGVTEVTHVGR